MRYVLRQHLFYLTVAAACLAGANNGFSTPVVDLRFYNVDDQMNATITNSAFAT